MVSSGFAFFLPYVLIKRARTGFMANVGHLILVIAVLIRSIFLGEYIGPEKVFAMVHITTGAGLS